MANDSVNISLPLKFEVKTAPRGMTDFDPKALSIDQQRELNLFKMKMRKEDVAYLAEHPEIKAVVFYVLRLVSTHHPLNVVNFVSKRFSGSQHKIRQQILDIMNESGIEYEKIPFSDHEHWDY